MEAEIYVGTYGKYNGGSLYGAWIDLMEHSDKKGFFKACKKLHKGEKDPEYMFQDYDGILGEMPKAWLSESHISENVFEFLAAYRDEASKGEAFLSWLNATSNTGDFSSLQSQFDECYEGEYENEEAYAEYVVEQTGMLTSMGDLSYYFDYSAYARDLFMTEYTYIEGVVYRNR